MITKDEIEQKSEEFGIHSANVERDYVFGWLLAGIYSDSALRDTLVLKGGNCFRKAYFPNTRFSNDLDFSAQSGIQESFLLKELKKVCDFVQARTGVVFDNDRNRVQEKNNADSETQVYEARLYFQDFYGNPDTITISVRLDVTQYDRIYLPVQSRHLIHPYSDASECGVDVRCQKLEELLATKLKCLLQRRHSGDLYDFVYSLLINKQLDVQRSEIVSTFLRKTIFEPSPGSVRGLLLDLPLQVFRGLWEKFLVCPKDSVINFDTAIEAFKNIIEALFGGFSIGYRGRLTFFPSTLRNPIMEAAGTLTLLEVIYDGYRRMVEPYSLVFKRRQDGVAREYFYVYDRTGGRRGPGIKAFVADKITEIRNTTDNFDPRYPVELSKSGEFSGKTYFGSSFSRRGRRVAQRSAFARLGSRS